MEPRSCRRQFTFGLAAATAASALNLVGCGSGEAVASGGRIVLTIHWPVADERYLSQHTDTATATLIDGAGVTTTKTLTQDDPDETIVFYNVAAGDLKLKIDASEGGVIVSTQTLTHMLVEGDTWEPSFDLVSQLTAVKITAPTAGATLTVGVAAPLAVIALVGDQQVTIDDGDVLWAVVDAAENQTQLDPTDPTASWTPTATGDFTLWAVVNSHIHPNARVSYVLHDSVAVTVVTA